MRSWSSRLNDAAFAALFKAGYPLAPDGPHDEQLVFMTASSEYAPINELYMLVNPRLAYDMRMALSWMRDRYEVQLVAGEHCVCVLDAPVTLPMLSALKATKCTLALTGETPETWMRMLGKERMYIADGLAVFDALTCAARWLAPPVASRSFTYTSHATSIVARYATTGSFCILDNVSLADAIASGLRPAKIILKTPPRETLQEWQSAFPNVSVNITE